MTSMVLDVSGVSFGCSTPSGELTRQRREALGNALAHIDGVDTFLERHQNYGETVDRLGAHRGDPRSAVDRGLDGTGDDLLDLLGREAGTLGLDRHLRRDELGEDIEGRAQRQNRSGDDPDHGERRHETAVAYRPSDESIHEGA